MKLKRLVALAVIVSFLVGSTSIVFGGGKGGGFEIDPEPWAFGEIQ